MPEQEEEEQRRDIPKSNKMGSLGCFDIYSNLTVIDLASFLSLLLSLTLSYSHTLERCANSKDDTERDDYVMLINQDAKNGDKILQ